jgi:hypothetical protein
MYRLMDVAELEGNAKNLKITKKAMRRIKPTTEISVTFSIKGMDALVEEARTLAKGTKS